MVTLLNLKSIEDKPMMDQVLREVITNLKNGEISDDDIEALAFIHDNVFETIRDEIEEAYTMGLSIGFLRGVMAYDQAGFEMEKVINKLMEKTD